MAKTPANAATTALKAALPPGIKVIEIPEDAEVLVDVDVNDMVIPYTVAADGNVVIKSLVDRREPLSLAAGTHRLGWSFSHAAKGWMHKIALKVDGSEKLLEKKSEASKDQDHSVGVVFLVVA
ncbi:MAG TPA: hypothetical protein VFB92_21450 [Vicinamibacterales bacterium]|jgi:hypothetical protein|nr:hypothetical protein [Vicinamibacterales bacterium]